MVIPARYESAGSFSEGLAPVGKDGKWGYIDKTGKEIIPFKYDNGYIFSEGLAPVRKDGKWGYIDKTGKEITPFKYDDAYGFSEGLAVVATGDFFSRKRGYIDNTGNEVIPLIYESANSFSKGLASVRLNGYGGFIDKKGVFMIYTSQNMKIICENLLESCIKQISDYKTAINKSSGSSFQIKRPYLLVSAKSSECKDIDFVCYSEGNFNEQSLEKLKTLVVEYEYADFSRTYTRTVNGLACEAKVTSVGSYLIYFDVEKRQCIGHDVMGGPKLPDKIETSSVVADMIGTNKIKNIMEDFIRMIESHLTNPIE